MDESRSNGQGVGGPAGPAAALPSGGSAPSGVPQDGGAPPVSAGGRGGRALPPQWILTRLESKLDVQSRDIQRVQHTVDQIWIMLILIICMWIISFVHKVYRSITVSNGISRFRRGAERRKSNGRDETLDSPI